MQIEDCQFGQIVIAGRRYDRDVIVFPGRVYVPWWRREGHSLCLEDLAEVLKESPQVLVIGTGYHGVMQVPQATLAALQARGIKTRVLKTPDAVAELNRLAREAARVVAALHLTC